MNSRIFFIHIFARCLGNPSVPQVMLNKIKQGEATGNQFRVVLNGLILSPPIIPRVPS